MRRLTCINIPFSVIAYIIYLSYNNTRLVVSRLRDEAEGSVLPNVDAPRYRGVPPPSLATGEHWLALQPEARQTGVLHTAAQPVVEEDRAHVAVNDGARVDTGGQAGDLAPGRGPFAVPPTDGDRGARDHVAGPTAKLGQLPGRERLLVVQLEVGGQLRHSALDCLALGRDLETGRIAT